MDIQTYCDDNRLYINAPNCYKKTSCKVKNGKENVVNMPKLSIQTDGYTNGPTLNIENILLNFYFT